MKADFQHLGLGESQDTLRCYWVRSPMFGFHWHYHPELEITYVHHGHGIRLVGNNVSDFRTGDMVLLGSNLPHTWISDDDFNAKKENMEVVVLQFPPDLFPGEWMRRSELSSIQSLFEQSARGILFSETTRKMAGLKIINLCEKTGFERLMGLWDLLHFLSNDATPDYLASQDFHPSLKVSTEQRILKVCQHIHSSFTEPIRLEEAASLASMNPTSFCRFFKKVTGQTFTHYLTDLRIGKASNLLIDEPHHTIAEIAFMSGFNSQTLFNRAFLKRKSMTPREFRQKFDGNS